MTAYIIIGHFDFEGDVILAVRFDRESAQAAYDRERETCHYDKYRLEAWNENGPAAEPLRAHQ